MVAAAEQLDDDIDLRSVAAALWARKAWIVVSMIAFTIPLTVAAFLAVPTYRTATVVADARSDSGANSLTQALGALGNLGGNVARLTVPGATAADEAMAVMRSREFTERFIRDHNLMPALFPDLWDASKGDWKVPGQAPPISNGYKLFNQIRTVTQAGRGGLITVTVEWRDPVQAADWANALVAQLNDEMRGRAINSTKLSVGYLERELAATSTIDTRQAINRLMEAQINQRMLANVTEEYAFRTVERALPPDLDDSVGPSKLVLIALGPSLGAIFGIFVVLVLNVLLARKSARTAQ